MRTAGLGLRLGVLELGLFSSDQHVRVEGVDERESGNESDELAQLAES